VKGAVTFCRRCGAELIATGRHAKPAHAAGLCLDCWLDVPSVEMKPVPACSRCRHGAEIHLDEALACVCCALSPLAHAMGMGCGDYTPRTLPRPGAACRAKGCACAGYLAEER
jgi:hypothetical protein